jgi:hypothetical protein
METFILYLFKVSGCLALFYAAFLLLFKRDTNFRNQRLYLLVSISISIILSFNTLSFRTLPSETIVDEATVPSASVSTQQNIQNAVIPAKTETSPLLLNAEPKTGIDYSGFLSIIYLLISGFLLFRIMLGFVKLGILLVKSEKTQLFNRTVYLSHKIEGSTSIFGFVFLNPALRNHTELSKIILHETIHASQYHSFDVFLVELLAAAMWFNPVVWLLRRSLQQLHEYLADEGVLRSGVNRLEYQTLLVNHIAEDSLVLSSGFNSSIKNRIFMMTQNNVNQNTKLKIIALVPIAFLLFFGISCMNKPKELKAVNEPSAKVQTDTVKIIAEKQAPEAQEAVKTTDPTNSDNPVAAVALSKMNVLYIGVDNPVTIAVSNHDPSELKVSIDNGSIVNLDESHNNFSIHPKQVGRASLSIYIGDKLISREEFRVKFVPDPVAKIAGKKGGIISKSELLKAGKVQVFMENFDFDLSFRVTSFSFPEYKDGVMHDAVSKGENFTDLQIESIKTFKSGQKFYIVDIKCAGPDGRIRELGALAFQIE